MSCLRVVSNSHRRWPGFPGLGQYGPRQFLCLMVGAILFVLTLASDGKAFDDPPPPSLIRELRIGLAAHDVDGLWSGDSKEKGPDLCAEMVFNRSLLTLLDFVAYPNAGITINTRGDTSKVFGGFRVEWQPFSSLMVASGLGLALHNGKRKAGSADRKSLGSQVLFRIPIEIGWALNSRYRIVLAFDHISNAYLFSPNEGMDTLGLMIGYRF